MSEHTPGPWKVLPHSANDDGCWSVVAVSDEVVICTEPCSIEAYESCTIVTPQGQEANARLMAAVPEAYEALNWLGSHMLGAKDGGDIWCAMRRHPGAQQFFKNMKAFLAKATGKAVKP